MRLDRLNAVQIQNTFVSRIPADSLTESINCLSPIATRLELNIIDKKNNNISDTLKRQFLYSFWLNRQPENPELGWLKYKAEVKKKRSTFCNQGKKEVTKLIWEEHFLSTVHQTRLQIDQTNQVPIPTKYGIIIKLESLIIKDLFFICLI